MRSVAVAGLLLAEVGCVGREAEQEFGRHCAPARALSDMIGKQTPDVLTVSAFLERLLDDLAEDNRVLPDAVDQRFGVAARSAMRVEEDVWFEAGQPVYGLDVELEVEWRHGSRQREVRHAGGYEAERFAGEDALCQAVP